MRPRIPTYFYLQIQTGTASQLSQPLKLQRTFTASSQQCKPTSEKQRKHRDPYALAQAQALKAANLARQDVLKKERAASLGNPVRGVLTPFVESFDHAVPQAAKPADTSTARAPTAKPSSETSASPANAEAKVHLNYLVSSTELRDALEHSRFLTEPIQSPEQKEVDEEADTQQADRQRQQHAKAETALARIVSLANGSSQDRTRVNIQRCIDTFGRHNTDEYLKPRPASNVPRDPALPPTPEKTPRAGPDTGSSEVQIGILTAKIRVLANHLETTGRMDKVNKRNLRLLVHRRQKLLTYLRRKERGGERWQNLVNTLGLTDGTWKGEISL
ncbi:MAG: hypothetical protein M1836_005848 [Candelina mexicana]|nr:MAG: hypothetical protein M1836_005848 [Candelina mexicana]